MRRILGAFVALTLAGTLLLVASPAEAARKYTVTVAASATQRDVGQSVTLSGKVGPRARGERVKVQRRVGSRWVTVARPKLNRKSRYLARVLVAAPGTNQFRVLKPRSAGHPAGVSPTVTVTGWRWRSLTTRFDAHVGVTADSASATDQQVAHVSVRQADNLWTPIAQVSMYRDQDPIHVVRTPATIAGASKIQLFASVQVIGSFVAWGAPKVYCRS